MSTPQTPGERFVAEMSRGRPRSATPLQAAYDRLMAAAVDWFVAMNGEAAYPIWLVVSGPGCSLKMPLQPPGYPPLPKKQRCPACGRKRRR